MRRAQATALAALVAVLVGAGTSSADVVLQWPNGDLPETFQRWADDAYMPMPGMTITVRATTSWCPIDGLGSDLEGCYDGDTDTIGVNMADPGPHRFVLLHELGHAVDQHALTDADRDQFRAITHDRRAWDRSSWDGWFNYNPPLERFADAFGLCAMKRKLNLRDLDRGRWANDSLSVDMQYGYAPTPRQHVKVCALIRAAVKRFNRLP